MPRVTSSLLAIALATTLATPAAARPPSGPGARPRPLAAQILNDLRRIDPNSISMVVKNTGSFSYDTQHGAAGLEYPKGSGKTAMFAAGLWMGALVNGRVRVSVAEYSDDFRPGAIIGSGAGATPDTPSKPEYKVYELLRSYPTLAERDAALADYNAGAVPHGAPVVSVQPDGTLDILGDQMLWTVFNDLGKTAAHNGASSALPLGIEVQLTAFAFAGPSGPADRAVFLRYRFLNKGANVLDGLHVGMWADPDLGGFSDDLIGGDPVRGMGYVYNGAGADEQYGGAPPALGVDMLAAPGGLGATAFVHYANGAGPQDSVQTYNNLQGLQGSGAPIIDPTTGLPARFTLTGDPAVGTGWLDASPSDKRMLLSTGPVTMLPGTSLEGTYAIVIGQGSNRLSSVLAMRCDDDAIQTFHDRTFAAPLPPEPNCGQFVNCPRPAAYWSEQVVGAGADFTATQLAEIAHRVDATSLYLDWSADPLASLRLALDPGSATTPLGQAIRQYAAFLCNIAVSSPVILPASGPPIFLDLGTLISCAGLEANFIQDLAGTAVRGLSDASYVDVGPNPTALTGVPSVLPLWGGAAGYAADVYGSSIPSGSPNTHTVEIRFTGGPTGQYAYRYLRTLDAGGSRVYLIQDYVPAPFTVWDVDANVQLNAAFLENAGPPPAPNLDGHWDPDESLEGGRELVWVMDSPYSGDATPDLRYFNDPTLQDILLGNVDLRYVMWPRLTAAGAIIDNGDLFRFTWGGVVPGPSVDAKLFQLAALDPGDPTQAVGYGNISSCLGDIDNGIGIGTTCDRPTPTLISLVSIEATPDRVRVTWYAGGTAASRVQVERRENAGAWLALADVSPDGSGMIEFVDTHVVPGAGYGYRLRVSEGTGLHWAGEASIAVPLHAALALEGFHPNPAGRDVRLAFSLASRAPATLSVFDVGGRRVFSREVGALGPGAHVVALDRGGSLPSGVYLLRLEQEGRSITRRAIAIR